MPYNQWNSLSQDIIDAEILVKLGCLHKSVYICIYVKNKNIILILLSKISVIGISTRIFQHINHKLLDVATFLNRHDVAHFFIKVLSTFC